MAKHKVCTGPKGGVRTCTRGSGSNKRTYKLHPNKSNKSAKANRAASALYPFQFTSCSGKGKSRKCRTRGGDIVNVSRRPARR